MKLWVCIPVHNRIQLTLQCLESLYKQDINDYEVVMCDDGSTDGTAEEVARRYPGIQVLYGDGNLWWTGAVNRCVEHALAKASAGDCIVTLNNDLEVRPDYLRRLYDAAKRYPKSLITSVVYDIDNGKLVSPGYRQNWITGAAAAINPEADHLPDDPDVAWITHASGRGTLIPVSVFHRVGFFDEKHLPHYGADYDFSYSARRSGFDVYVCFSARVYSHIAETGITAVRSLPFWPGLRQYLTSRKSPANLGVRWRLALNNCPKWLLPSYLLLDFLRVMGSYLKCRLSSITGSP
jgi:GT2 family glycosyltransferase